jgi:hypothetical protein
LPLRAVTSSRATNPTAGSKRQTRNIRTNTTPLKITRAHTRARGVENNDNPTYVFRRVRFLFPTAEFIAENKGECKFF